MLRAGSVGACAGLHDTMVDQLAALLLLLSGGVAIDLCFFFKENTHFPNGREGKVSQGSLCGGRSLVSGKEVEKFCPTPKLQQRVSCPSSVSLVRVIHRDSHFL